MPLVSSSYNPPLLFRNGHFSTIHAGLLRKVGGVVQERERLTLSDGDFLDLDWSCVAQANPTLFIVFHGLEGNAQRPYMLGVIRHANRHGYDAVGVNLRNCSGTPNHLYRSYHSGASEDVAAVVEHILNSREYTNLILVGFSLGGNLILKYLGERNSVPEQLKGGIAISAPCYLYGSMLEIHKLNNILYYKRFKKNLVQKLKEKQRQFPEAITEEEIRNIVTLRDFDDCYTSKAHGFKDALDYYERSSSLQFLKNIGSPTLILNAQNDSFLSQECYPNTIADTHPNLFLEVPKYGGHVGFYDKDNIYYSERRALSFAQEVIEVV